MLKTLGGVYEPGRRADSWLKMKKDYVEGMQDSLDLVVIGAWRGSGRKAGWYRYARFVSIFLYTIRDVRDPRYVYIPHSM